MRRLWNRIGFCTATVSIASLVACHSENDPFEDLVDFASSTEGGKDEGNKGGGKGAPKDSTGGDDKKSSKSKKGGKSNEESLDKDGTGGGKEKKKDCVLPARYIVLGDAIPEGKTGIDGPDDPANAFKMMHTYIKEKYKVQELSYENVGKSGTSTKDVPGGQMDEVETGKPGHVLVNIHVGGNDLAKFILKSDKAAQDAFDGTISQVEADWVKMFEHFENKDDFPDGATFIVNTQYNPFDDCTEAHNLFRLSNVKIDLMKKFNQRLVDLADARDNAVVADQYGVFLGHGHHHDKSKCPHYKDGADYWLVGGTDLTHINEKGYAAMGGEFEKVADSLYSGCTKRD